MQTIDEKKLTDLIIRAQNHDSQAFADLYALSYQRVYTTALTLLKNEENAEDVTQNVFIRIMDSLHTLRNPKQYFSWLYRVTYRQALDFITLENRYPRDSDTFEYFPDPDVLIDPLASCIQNERQALVAKALLSLPVKYRTTLLLKYYYGEKIQDIAEMLDCSPGTVKSRLHKGRQLLKQSLHAKGVHINIFGAVPLAPALGALANGTTPESMAASVKEILHSRGQTTHIHISELKPSNKIFSNSGGSALTSSLGVALVGGGLFCCAIGWHTLSIAPPESTTPQPPVIETPVLPEAYSTSITLSIPVKSDIPLAQVYLTSDTGERITATAQSPELYTAVLQKNGHYTITVETNTGISTSQEIVINTIDREAPQLQDYTWNNNTLVITLNESKSGINMASIYAETPDGTQLKPIQTNAGTPEIIFEMPASDATIYFSDNVGNDDSIDVSTEKRKKNVGIEN
ncbi:MAG: RNA polymerase sigma factor [Eubacterium sp.]